MTSIPMLEGVRILAVEQYGAGPFGTMYLADLGAEVIKIESRDGGDPGRGLLRMSGLDLGARPNFYFEANNRNKKSIALDLKKAAGREVVYRLAAVSDVFVQNFRHGVAARLELDAATLRRRNAKLVYASASGYGPRGPDAGEPSFDHLGLARSGIMLAAGEPGMPPLAIAGGVADQMGAIMLAYGVLAALLARERLGVGQDVDASHLGSMLMLQGLSVSAKLMMGFAIPRLARTRAGNPLWNHYRCADDKWLALAMLQPDRYWAHFARAIDRPELAGDPRFADLRARAQNAEACVALLDECFAARPRAEWLAVLRESPGDFIFTVVNSVDELPDDPQVRANDYVVDFDHPSFGKPVALGDAGRDPASGTRVRSAHGGGADRAPRLLLGRGRGTAGRRGDLRRCGDSRRCWSWRSAPAPRRSRPPRPRHTRPRRSWRRSRAPGCARSGAA
jgi:crotonobetainyl-CoA:carnitine CoA-transferase CaiB-like acyl-CoA transferase